MKLIIFLSVLIIITVVSGNFLNPYPKFEKHFDDEDPGEPLFLTPYINKGQIKDARDKAKVIGNKLQSVESYSGYLTVDKTKKYESNLFFWYFPAQENRQNAPVILWLQGGPGSSSLFGLFAENGPFLINANGQLDLRKYSWHKNHHLIYIDNPVGTGYSFTTSELGYSKDENEVGRNLYEAIVQIFTVFPELQNLDFWVTGESYGGKYVPALAHTIHQFHKLRKRKTRKVNINLKGMAIGNGFSDPINQLRYSGYLYQIGLIDLNGKHKFFEYEQEGLDCIKKRDMECAFNKFDDLIDGDVSTSGSLFKNLTGFDMYYNYLKTKNYLSGDNFGKFLQLSKTRKAIHVGNNTFHDTDTENLVEKHLKNDIMDSVSTWVAEILNNNYRVCIYNGQLDIIVAYPLTENYLQKLKFNRANVYKRAPRYIWRVQNEQGESEIAGYAKEAGNLVEVLVRNAGHMSLADQPRWVFDMITRLTYGKGFH